MLPGTLKVSNIIWVIFSLVEGPANGGSVISVGLSSGATLS